MRDGLFSPAGRARLLSGRAAMMSAIHPRQNILRFLIGGYTTTISPRKRIRPCSHRATVLDSHTRAPPPVRVHIRALGETTCKQDGGMQIAQSESAVSALGLRRTYVRPRTRTARDLRPEALPVCPLGYGTQWHGHSLSCAVRRAPWPVGRLPSPTRREHEPRIALSQIGAGAKAAWSCCSTMEPGDAVLGSIPPEHDDGLASLRARAGRSRVRIQWARREGEGGRATDDGYG